MSAEVRISAEPARISVGTSGSGDTGVSGARATGGHNAQMRSSADDRAVARSNGANAESGIRSAADRMSFQRLAGAEEGDHGNPWSEQLVATNVPTSKSWSDSSG